MPQKLLKTTEK